MRRNAYVLAATLLLAFPAGLLAQGWIEPPPGRPMPPAVTRVSSSVRVRVEGPVALFEVEERYRNTGGGLAEGSYLFPLPGEAIFTEFSLYQGSQELRGEIMTAEQARGIYEEFVRRKRDPALLTLAGHGLVRAQVFPIQPGETRTVVLRFTQRLERAGDALGLRYSLGGRGGSAGTVRMTVTLPDAARFGRPYSPTHVLQTDRTGRALTVSLESTPDNGEVSLLLPLAERSLGGSILTHAPAGRDAGFFMLLVTPTEVSETVIPRDITFVVDVSGSMAGEKLAQAKAALRQALNNLAPTDRFRLIAFSSDINTFRDTPTTVTPTAVREAVAFVDGLTAHGGTNIQGALETALDGASPAGRLGLVMFLTDGLPSVGEQGPEALGALAAGRVRDLRVFPIGVGHDVNTYLLDRLAREGRGTADYVAPGGSVELAIGRVFARTSRPALTDLRIVRSPVVFEDQAPTVLPDVFYGDEVVVTGRYRGQGSGPVIVEGRRNGRVERIIVEATFSTRSDDNRFLTTLWASRRIGELTQSLRLEGNRPEIVADIRELGLRYGVLTEYTSYLVQEPGVVANGLQILPAVPRAEAQVGQRAVEDAQASARMRDAKTVSAAAGGLSAGIRAARTPQNEPIDVRRTGNRMLVKRGGVWTDVAARDSLPTVAVAEFSAAYFDLVHALPELGELFAEGGPLLLGGRTVNLRIAGEGLSAWRPGELDRFIKAYRGA